MSRAENATVGIFNGVEVPILGRTKDGYYVPVSEPHVGCVILDGENKYVGSATRTVNRGRQREEILALQPGQQYAELIMVGDSRLRIQADNVVAQFMADLQHRFPMLGRLRAMFRD